MLPRFAARAPAGRLGGRHPWHPVTGTDPRACGAGTADHIMARPRPLVGTPHQFQARTRSSPGSATTSRRWTSRSPPARRLVSAV